MKLLVKNSLSGVAQLLLTACLTFYSIPVFIKNLGAEAYGIYAVIGIIGNLNVVVNLGLNTSLLRFLGNQGKCKESDQDIMVTILILLTILIPLSAIALYYRHSVLVNILGINESSFKQSEGLYIGVLLANIILIIGQTFTTLLDVTQRTYLVNSVQFFYSLLYWIGNIILIHLGYGLNEIGFSIVASAFIWFFLILIFAKKYWGWLDTDDFSKNFMRLVRKQISYGASVYSAGLFSFLYEPLTKLILARVFGVTAAGYYDIASRVKGQIYGIASRALYPLYPWITKQKSVLKIRDTFEVIQSKILFLLIPFCILLYACMPYLVEKWLGENNPQIAWMIIGLTISYLIFSVTVIPTYHFLTAGGYAKYNVIVQIINVTLNLIILLIGRPFIGIYAVVAGHVIAQLFSFMFLQYCQRKYLGTYALQTNKDVISLIALAMMLCIIPVSLHYFVDDNMIVSILSMLLIFFTSLFFYRSNKIFKIQEIESFLGNKNSISSIVSNVLVKS